MDHARLSTKQNCNGSRSIKLDWSVQRQRPVDCGALMYWLPTIIAGLSQYPQILQLATMFSATRSLLSIPLALWMAPKIIHSVSILQSRVLVQQNQLVYLRLAFILQPIRVYNSVFMAHLRVILFLALLSTVVRSQLHKLYLLHQPRARLVFILFRDGLEGIGVELWERRERGDGEEDIGNWCWHGGTGDMSYVMVNDWLYVAKNERHSQYPMQFWASRSTLQQ